MKSLSLLFILLFSISSWALNKSERRLLDCSWMGHLDCVQEVANKGVNIMSADRKKQNSLHRVAFLGHLKIAQFIIDKLSTPQQVMAYDREGNTPLHYAAQEGSIEIVRLLINTLPTSDHILAKNKDHSTPFELSLIGNRQNVARILFGSSSYKVRKQLIAICYNNKLIFQAFCEKLQLSLEDQTFQEIGGYQ